MNIIRTTAPLVLSAALLTACAGYATQTAGPAMVTDGILTGANGMTLYTFDKDAGGKSACNDQCAKIWPPVMAAADAKASGDLTIITRDDGGKQWAYKGKPVYLYSKDAKAGDKSGDNFKDVWHAAKP